MSGESSHTLMPGVPELPPIQMSPMGELQLGQPQLNTLPPWETWCPPLPGIIATGWSIEVMTWVVYVIMTLQGSEKCVLGFESCFEPWVTQQEFAWSKAAAVPRWMSSIGLASPEMGAVTPKRSWDFDSPPTPSKQLPPSKRMIIPSPGFPVPLNEVTQVSYAEMVQENQCPMDALMWGQEQHWVVESALKPTLPPQLAPKEPEP